MSLTDWFALFSDIPDSKMCILQDDLVLNPKLKPPNYHNEL